MSLSAKFGQKVINSSEIGSACGLFLFYFFNKLLLESVPQNTDFFFFFNVQKASKLYLLPLGLATLKSTFSDE